MIKLYLIIYMGGLIGGTVGPLPYDEAECKHRAADLAKAYNVARGLEGVSGDQFAFKCEWHEQRPALQMQ